MSHFPRILLALVVAADLAGCDGPAREAPAPKASLFDRVNAAGTIHAAYVVYPPSMIKDPNTGTLSGISVDVMRRAAEDLGLKLEFTEEVGWGTMIEGLEAGRYDLVVSGIWPNASRARKVAFTKPLFYSGIGAYGRVGEQRIAADLSNLDDPQYKIATIDGEMSDAIAKSQFPKATRVSLPQSSDVATMLLNVKESKADITFVEPAIAFTFAQSNPDSIADVRPGSPVRVFGNTVMLPADEPAFTAMIDTSIEVLLNSGEVDRIVDRYEPYPGAFFRTAHPYRASGPASP